MDGKAHIWEAEPVRERHDHLTAISAPGAPGFAGIKVCRARHLMRGSIHKRVTARLLLIAPLLASCGNAQQPAQNAPPPPQVTVAKPVQRTIVDYDEYVGRFVAVDSVEIRARVSGYLASVHFTDGQMVKKGDLLVTIDKRPL